MEKDINSGFLWQPSPPLKWEAKDTLQTTTSKGRVTSRVTAGIPVAVLFWKHGWWECLCCCQPRLLLPSLDTKPKEMESNISEGQNFKKHCLLMIFCSQALKMDVILFDLLHLHLLLQSISVRLRSSELGPYYVMGPTNTCNTQPLLQKADFLR